MSKQQNLNIVCGLDVTENAGQRELIRLIQTNWQRMPIVFCEGDAGTGKTIAALAGALSLLGNTYSKIYYIREPEAVGKDLGALPGTIDEKFDPYLGALADNLEHLTKFSGESYENLRSKIKPLAPQYCRGRSFENAIVIVDEAQNLRYDSLQMLITRLGKYCKLIVLASTNQIDTPGMYAGSNDFTLICNILRSKFSNLIGYVELITSMRSAYCADFDKALTDYKKAHPNEVHNFKPLEERIKFIKN